MGKFYYDSIIRYSIKAKTTSPLHIGSSLGDKEDILINADGNPFIQASSLAGMLRGGSEIVNGESKTSNLFGGKKADEGSNANDYRSRIRVSDGNIDYSTVKLELRPHVAIDKKTGTAKGESGSGHKFNLTYLSAGAVFNFDIYLYLDKARLDDQKQFENVLGMLTGGLASIGAKKSSGAGKIQAEAVERNTYDMTVLDDRKAWVSDDTKYRLENITTSLRSHNQSVKYTVSVKADTIGAIQIKGIAMSEFGKNAPDSENIRNGAGEYIIPGSSMRGTIRSQMERIASYLGKEDVIDNAFGVARSDHSNSHAGALIFNDCVIGKIEDNDMNALRNRIHIDKFTGGVMDKALFREKNAAGELKGFEIQILDHKDADRILGLLTLALRDLSSNLFGFGNGYATGKGFLDVKEIKVIGTDSEATITYTDGDGKLEDGNNLLSKALQALKEVKNAENI